MALSGILIGLMVIAAWILDIPLLKSFSTEYRPMQFNTAIGCVIWSFGMLCLSFRGFRYAKTISKLCALLVILIGGATALQDILQIDFGIDQLLMQGGASVYPGGIHPGRMPPLTSLSMCLAGFALGGLSSKRRGVLWVSQYILYWGMGGGLVTLIGFLYQVPAYYKKWFLVSIAPPTALAYILLAVGGVMLHPNIGITALFTGNKIGNKMARRMFPLMAIAVFFIGLLRNVLYRLDFVSVEFGSALIVVGFLGVILIVIWGAANWLNNIDAQRLIAEEAIQNMNKGLEIIVAERTADLNASLEKLRESEDRLQQSNEELNDYARKLEQTNSSLEQFAYVASHDLQEPLRTITNFAGLLESKKKDMLDSDSQNYLSHIVQASKRMKELVRDLLLYSRTGKNHMPEIVDLGEVVKDVLTDLHASIEESRANINIGNLPVIRAGKTEMHQLFQNLINNAIKYRKEGVPPEISIGAEKQNSHWLFWVKDNGIGIEQEYSEKVFVIFQRLHLAQEYSGTGIGLATCKKIVEMYNGKIWMESEFGKGSIFYFTLNNAEEGATVIRLFKHG